MEITNKNILITRTKIIYIMLILVIFSAAIIFFVSRYYDRLQRPDENIYEIKNKSAYKIGTVENKPQPLQELFLYDVKNGINDKYTKSDAYFIVSRYLNNGGDIYEIYDYINNHKELAFLQEAETIYPSIFDKIKKRDLPTFYTEDGLYATLAYFEIIEKYGYGDMAVRSTLAHQYIKLAFLEKKKLEISSDLSSDDIIEKDKNKAIYFAEKINNNILQFGSNSGVDFENLIDSTKFSDFNSKFLSKVITPHDFLIGITQYAASLRYFESVGVSSLSKISPSTLFSISTIISNNFIPEHLLGISILNASTLNILNTDNAEEIAVALKPIIETGVVVGARPVVVERILKARLEKEVYFIGTNTRNINFDQYGKKNITELAKKVPDFKKWLLLNGWLERDFEINP